jgi:hypothetical protein
VHAVSVLADASAGNVPSICPPNLSAGMAGRSWPAGRRYLAAPRRSKRKSTAGKAEKAICGRLSAGNAAREEALETARQRVLKSRQAKRH